MFALRVTHFSCVTTRNLFKRRHLPVCGGGRRKVTANAMSGSVDERADAVLKYWFDDEYASWPKGKYSDEWFPKWFGKSDTTDQEIKYKFAGSVEAIRSGTIDTWLARPRECLAGIILMDQFTRNIYRGTADMYCLDDKAKQWAAHLASDPAYFDFHPALRNFIWLPFMHGESMADQEVCIFSQVACAVNIQPSSPEPPRATTFTLACLKGVVLGDKVLLLQQCMELIKGTVQECKADLGEDHPLTKQMENTVNFSQLHMDIVQKYGRFPHRNELLGRQSTAEEKAGLADGSIQGF